MSTADDIKRLVLDYAQAYGGATEYAERDAAFAAIDALQAERDALAAQASRPPAVAWRCFHCDEEFTDREQAELHFGRSEHDQPACRISIEHVRWLEAQHRRNVDDDTEALRTIRGLAGEHERLRREAEEEGYARGLRDARKHPEELGLAAVSEPNAEAADKEVASASRPNSNEQDVSSDPASLTLSDQIQP